MQIAVNLRELREKKGLSQRELAKMAGVTKQTINNFEVSNNLPSFKSAYNISKILGIICEELVEGKKENDNHE